MIAWVCSTMFICVKTFDVSKRNLMSASGIIQRWKHILPVVSQVPGWVVESHHSHLFDSF